MIHNVQARNNYTDPESFTEHWEYFCNISNKSEKTVWISPIQSLLIGNVTYITL